MARKYMKSIESQELSWKCQTSLLLLAIIKFGNPVLVILLSSKNSWIVSPFYLFIPIVIVNLAVTQGLD